MTNDKQRERLVELIHSLNSKTASIDYITYKAAEEIADYFLANDIFVPPCKMGQTVYRVVVMSTGITRVIKKTLYPPYKCGVIVDCKPTIKRFIRSVIVTKNNFYDVVDNWGKTVFATREEAEQALKGGVQE